MTPLKRDNVDRLLNPQHVAVIGGRDAVTVIGELRRIGYAGEIWPVNPKRDSISGLACFDGVNDLPAAPDATFLAIPATPALLTVKDLARRGAGGIVCYTAGFSGDGSEGGEGDQSLIDAAGDMALVGPNCYGIINYINKVALWPFAHGGFCPGYGAAIVTQSGMLSSDITMNQRSVPLAYMVSAGNQSSLGLEDYIDVLCEKPEVRALGLHIEGLKDIQRFIDVAQKALALNKPLVVLKTGTSAIGAELTVSHTGSLSGTAETYQALFDRLGVISVSNPAQLIETLKYICVAGIPKGNKVMGFTCSGGGATMLADYAEKIGLNFTRPSKAVAVDLVSKLPSIAQVSNPLDYTTPIWGDPENLQPVFNAAFKDDYDSALILQDYPLPDINESKVYYANDAQCFINTTSKVGLPAAVCSTLPENIDMDTRQHLIENSVAPMQGIHETLNAIAGAAHYGLARNALLNQPSLELVQKEGSSSGVRQLDEWSSKQALHDAGLQVPESQLLTQVQIDSGAVEVSFPVALKVNSDQIAHKTELGAVALNLRDLADIQQAAGSMVQSVKAHSVDITTDVFLVEVMQEKPLLELMVSVRSHDNFGLVMTLATGGVMIELLQDAVTLILPVNQSEIAQALMQLKLAPMLKGYRGKPAVDIERLSDDIQKIGEFVITNKTTIAELEINPLFVYQDRAVIVDALMHKVTKISDAGIVA
ncbi:MAG: acyl-CoA synthetase (NDP forming) [Gammaproteobacteria bacterium]|jgi:acyl-CoA synthetase (NDP forming)